MAQVPTSDPAGPVWVRVLLAAVGTVVVMTVLSLVHEVRQGAAQARLVNNLTGLSLAVSEWAVPDDRPLSDVSAGTPRSRMLLVTAPAVIAVGPAPVPPKPTIAPGAALPPPVPGSPRLPQPALDPVPEVGSKVCRFRPEFTVSGLDPHGGEQPAPPPVRRLPRD